LSAAIAPSVSRRRGDHGEKALLAASWLDLVERLLGEITRKRIRRGAFTSVADLEEPIHDYLDSEH
jgi:hypothetical protein